jgi:hypothetical protein
MRTLSGQANAKIKDIFRTTADDYDEEQGASSWLDSGNNVYLGASGNVGIGDSTPSYKLDVTGTARITGTLTINGAMLATASTQAIDILATNNGSGGSIARMAVTCSNARESGFYLCNSTSSSFPAERWLMGRKYNGGSAFSDLAFFYTTTSGGSNGDGYSEIMRLKTNGNVGVGTNNPSHKLHVHGGDILLHSNGDGDKGLRIYQSSHGIYGNLDVENSGSTNELILNMGINYSNGGGTRVANINGGWFRVDTRLDAIYTGFHWFWQGTNNSAIELMTLKSNGNLGIGDGTPSYKLDVAGDINLTGSLRINGTVQTFGGGSSVWTESSNVVSYGTGTAGTIKINSTDSVDKIQLTKEGTNGSKINHAGGWKIQYKAGPGNDAGATGAHSFYTTQSSAYQERMSIISNGNVGIGIASPSQKLSVNGSIEILGQNDLLFRRTDGSESTTISSNAEGFIISENRGSYITKYQMGGDDHIFSTNNAERMRILSSGYVGIGTTNPQKELHIHDSANTNCFLQLSHTGTGSNVGDGVAFGVDGSGNVEILGREDADFLIYTNNVEKMRILSNGNVGIGDTTPSYKLDVNGTCRVTGVMTIDTYIGRNTHNTGHLCGGYNNLGANDAKSNPIYTIGSGYLPAETTLASMYGIGYCNDSATFTASTGGWGMYVAEGGNARIFLGAAAGGRTYFNTTGNFGIGTDNPVEKLDVNGCINITPGTAQSFSGENTGECYIKFAPGTSSNDWAVLRQIGGDNTIKLALDFHDDNNETGFLIRDVHSTQTPDDVYTRFCVERGGNVGIGTSDPNQQFHMYHATNCVMRLESPGDVQLILESDNNNAGEQDNPMILLSQDGGARQLEIGLVGDSGQIFSGSLGNHSFLNARQDGMQFGTNDSARITIEAAGNVGIATTNPSEKLHVHGKTLITGSGNDNSFPFYMKTSDDGGHFGFQWNGSGQNYNLKVIMKNNTAPYADHQLGRFENDTANTNATVFGNFTGQHRCIPNNNLDADKYGLIVYSTGKYVNIDNVIGPTMNDSLPICDLCSTENDVRVFGVISDERDDNDTRVYGYGAFKTFQQKTNTNEQRISINSLGEGSMWVCNKNGNVSNGSYITPSSVPGYGVKQDSNQLLNSTVAKITCDCDFNLTPIVKQKLKVIETTTTLQKQVMANVTITDSEIVFENGIYKKKSVSNTIPEPVYDFVPLYDDADVPLVDSNGNAVMYKIQRMEDYTETKTELVYDSNGNVQYEDDLDANGQQQMKYEYDTRFLNADATLIATEAEYNTKKANGENVYISCFVGCTYHCG